MPLTFKDIDFKVDLPRIPTSAPIISHTPPCTKDREDTIRAIAEVLNIDITGTAQLPHGYAIGSDHGQVEIYTASAAIRARNTDQLSAYPNEQRKWADVEQHKDGTYHPNRELTRNLTRHGQKLLDHIGLNEKPSHLDVTLSQWAQLNEDGKQIDSGPGRATIRLSYNAEGIPLIGPGAKTNLHFDPNDDGRDVTLARMFHVHRPTATTGEITTQSLDETFASLLTQNWSQHGIREGQSRITITHATFGLLALPADIVQTFAAPALMIEGEISGIEVGKKEPVTIRFGQYLPLTNPKALAEAGYGGGQLEPGTVTPTLSKQK